MTQLAKDELMLLMTVGLASKHTPLSVCLKLTPFCLLIKQMIRFIAGHALTALRPSRQLLLLLVSATTTTVTMPLSFQKSNCRLHMPRTSISPSTVQLLTLNGTLTSLLSCVTQRQQLSLMTVIGEPVSNTESIVVPLTLT